MTTTEIYERLTQVFRDVFMRDDLVVKADLSPSDVKGWDSLRQVDLVLEVEERFGIRCTSREVDGLLRAGDFAALIARKTEG
jgi:acyl carrier protein